ncbi:putative zinc-binding metallopeptidase [Thioclava sp. GXIMD4215]|uniref:zinc-binding metallopeptidase family protein n=1 Tax=Thioclava sp. GXIMD4215 TaxID=3131928 RepID=UPI00324FD0EF
MMRYHCPSCRAEVYFGNDTCLSCGTELVFEPGRGFLDLRAEGLPACENRARIGCNWVADAQEGAQGGLCLSCRHTTVIPDLSVEGNLQRWAEFEAAKRNLMRMAVLLDLPLTDSAGPRPRFLFKAPDAGEAVVMGHADGDITLNIAEADDEYRAATRAEMGEPYRTLIGHLRHESGHAFWEVLVKPFPDRLAACRALFGDEREDYGQALERHYAQPAPAGWEQAFVSEYATAHPYEDFAESWANLLHILDGLETALCYGLMPAGHELAAPEAPRDILFWLLGIAMEDLVSAWIALSLALNALNDSLGHPSFYPFILTPKVSEKLDWVRQVIRQGCLAD